MDTSQVRLLNNFRHRIHHFQTITLLEVYVWSKRKGEVVLPCSFSHPWISNSVYLRRERNASSGSNLAIQRPGQEDDVLRRGGDVADTGRAGLQRHRDS